MWLFVTIVSKVDIFRADISSFQLRATFFGILLTVLRLTKYKILFEIRSFTIDQTSQSSQPFSTKPKLMSE